MGVVVTTAGEPEPLPVDPERLGAGQIIVDLVYHPAMTPLLAAARERGLQGINGLGMLIHQAAHAFRLWTSEEAVPRGDERRRRRGPGPPGHVMIRSDPSRIH